MKLLTEHTKSGKEIIDEGWETLTIDIKSDDLIWEDGSFEIFIKDGGWIEIINEIQPIKTTGEFICR